MQKEKEIIQSTTRGSRARGRPKMTWTDNVKSWTGLSLTELVRNVEDRTSMEKDTANPRIARTAKDRQAGLETKKSQYAPQTQ